jgi:hypothetical protein
MLHGEHAGIKDAGSRHRCGLKCQLQPAYSRVVHGYVEELTIFSHFFSENIFFFSLVSLLFGTWTGGGVFLSSHNKIHDTHKPTQFQGKCPLDVFLRI